MKFRPCVDIHNGKVKQIVGSSLSIDASSAKENFVSSKSAADFALLYKKDMLTGGHAIKLSGTREDDEAMLSALKAYPGGLQAGGGMNSANCLKYLEAGASHIIVTSWLFEEGHFNMSRLEELVKICGKDHIVIDLSCMKNGSGDYIAAMNRWKTVTDLAVNGQSLKELSSYCDEFLVHAIASEGLRKGPDKELISLLADAAENGLHNGAKITYAGGIATFYDIGKVKRYGKGLVDFTVGSALDIFGGSMSYEKCAKKYGGQ